MINYINQIIQFVAYLLYVWTVDNSVLHTYRIHKLHVQAVAQLLDPVRDFVKVNLLSSSICQQINIRPNNIQ